MGRDIFISFSNADRKKVDKIVEAIRSFGVTVWYQLDDSKNNFLDEINLGIKESSAFVIFLSHSSVNSIMVRNEINRALRKLKNEKNYHILPVVLEGLNEEDEDVIDLLLGSFNWLFASDFDCEHGLALGIFNQIGIHFQNENEDSIYYGSNIETERIEKQNKLYNLYTSPYLDEIFNEIKNPTVLDVGCSDGANIILRLAGRKYKSLLGIDKNKSMLALAVQKYGNSKNKFEACDLTKDLETVLIKYLSDENMQGFDIIHISAVLLHISNPEEIVDKLYGFLNKGGYLLIQDEDDGCNIVYPSAKFFDNCFFIWEHSRESGDRKMGRKIAHFLYKLNFENVKLKYCNITSVGLNDSLREALWDLYFNPMLWNANSAEYFNDYKAFDLLPNCVEEHNTYKEKYMKGEIFIALGVFFYVAKK